MTAIRVLVIEDDPTLGNLITRLLGRAAMVPRVAGCVADAEDALAAETFDVLLVDRSLPDDDGVSFLERLRARGDRTPAVLMSGSAVSPPDAFTAFIKKPFTKDGLPLLLATMAARR
jgi:DNA-binding response OmpR family regulator